MASLPVREELIDRIVGAWTSLPTRASDAERDAVMRLIDRATGAELQIATQRVRARRQDGEGEAKP